MAPLEQCPLPVSLFISALELEVLHLHKKIAKLEVKNVTAQRQIDALKKELQEISERLHELETPDPELQKMIDDICLAKK